MPSRKRRLKALNLSQLDRALRNAPPHIKSRLGTPNSRSQLTINLASGLEQYDFRGLTYDSYGNPVAIPNRGHAGGKVHAEQADKKCRELKKKYIKIWGNRGQAYKIVEKENISHRTVLRYFTRCP
jgi:hypothetical protein